MRETSHDMPDIFVCCVHSPQQTARDEVKSLWNIYISPYRKIFQLYNHPQLGGLFWGLVEVNLAFCEQHSKETPLRHVGNWSGGTGWIVQPTSTPLHTDTEKKPTVARSGLARTSSVPVWFYSALSTCPQRVTRFAQVESGVYLCLQAVAASPDQIASDLSVCIWSAGLLSDLKWREGQTFPWVSRCWTEICVIFIFLFCIFSPEIEDCMQKRHKNLLWFKQQTVIRFYFFVTLKKLRERRCWSYIFLSLQNIIFSSWFCGSWIKTSLIHTKHLKKSK